MEPAHPQPPDVQPEQRDAEDPVQPDDPMEISHLDSEHDQILASLASMTAEDLETEFHQDWWSDAWEAKQMQDVDAEQVAEAKRNELKQLDV